MAIKPASTQFPIARLYAIIDPAQAGGRTVVEVADALVSAGVTLIQYRNKRSSAREVYEDGRQIAARIGSSGGLFVVNDRADVALALEADGVHLGQEDLPVESARRLLSSARGRTNWIGISAHTLAQIQEANRSPADYVAFGPIFATSSKERPDAVVGLDGLRRARQATRKPLVAIGGITLANAAAVIEAGADSVAVIGDLLRHPDIAARAREFMKVLDQ
ncbi:MAG TPA: thiamine phosphate synthase [Terriglobia bacterium]|nr:thiamine phosphate synthase [Terriglobia bacterium]